METEVAAPSIVKREVSKQDRDYYLKVFEQRYPRPEVGADQDRTLLKDHVGHIIKATNLVRSNIADGRWDDLTAEAAFHEIHDIHAGQDDLVKHVLATMDLILLEHDFDISIWHSGWEAANSLRPDMGYQKGKYRTSHISWGAIGRGVLGIDQDYVEDYAREFFGNVQDTINKVRSAKELVKPEPDEVLAYAVEAATIADIAHFKQDLNGRSTEDWMVWLQRQLLTEGDKPKFLSSHGIRARQSDLVLKPEYEGPYFDVQTRLWGRMDPVKHVRQKMYRDLAARLDLSPEQLQAKMPALAYERGVVQEMRTIRRASRQDFYDLLPYVDGLSGAKSEPFLPIENYIAKVGVDTFTAYSPDEVFK